MNGKFGETMNRFLKDFITGSSKLNASKSAVMKLSFRINLETGLKEAKLLENEKTGGSAVQVTPDSDTDSVDGNEEEIVNAKKLKLTDEQKASMKKINDYLDSLKTERESAELDVEVTHDFDVMKNLTKIISESNNFVVVDSGKLIVETFASSWLKIYC